MIKYFLFFGLILPFVSLSQELVRGPYLQSATQTSIILKWRATTSGEVEIRYGTDASNLDLSVKESDIYNHEVRLENLEPNTKYFYQIHSQAIEPFGSFFYTMPVKGAKSKLRFIALGDCGTGTPMQKEVLTSIGTYVGEKKIDGLLLLGDNAYNSGYDHEYQERFFPIYQDALLDHVVLWPSPGNHDYAGLVWPNSSGEEPDYFNMFSLPSNGESGGLASNSEAFYAYDVGNVHLISLDSYGTVEGKRMSDLLGKQAAWLESDLAQNTQEWTVVYFHHPPFSKGSHDSDKEQELIDIRNNVVPILDKYAVDLVLTGHSHTYERTSLIHNYSGDEGSFIAEKHNLSNSSGKYDGTDNSCPYIKSDSGTVYVVAGTAGWTGGTSEGYPHDAMKYSNNTETGALIFEVEGNRLDLKYLNSKGNILDKFTIVKKVNKTVDFTIDCGEKFTLINSWGAEAIWNSKTLQGSGISIDSLTASTTFWAQDPYACLADTFKVSVNAYTVPKPTSNSPILAGNSVELNTEFDGLGFLTWTGPNNFESNLVNPSLNATIDAAGIYTVKANYKDCLSEARLAVEIIPLLSFEASNETLKAYPNPMASILKVTFTPASSGQYTYRLLSPTGKQVAVKKLELEKNKAANLSFDLNTTGISGKLVLQVSSKNFQMAKTIIRQ